MSAQTVLWIPGFTSGSFMAAPEANVILYAKRVSGGSWAGGGRWVVNGASRTMGRAVCHDAEHAKRWAEDNYRHSVELGSLAR
jgi:hypothetical protein